jgi:hypothetical protein
MRQQRTNYKRQTIGTSQTQPLSSMLWWVESLAGDTAQLRILGPRDSLVLNGVPDVKPTDIGANPVSCQLTTSPSPDLYSILEITYDVDISAAASWLLEQASPALRNRQGGMMAPAVQPFPNPAFANVDIEMSVVSWSGAELLMSLSGAVSPLCIGAGWTITDTTQIMDSSPAEWLGSEVLFLFPYTLNVGDVITWAEDTTRVKGQWGGKLLAGSTTLL